MTRFELKLALDGSGISENAYSLDNGMPIERYVLSHEPDGRWATYYSERGHRQTLRRFENESDACEDLLARITRDSTTKSNGVASK